MTRRVKSSGADRTTVSANVDASHPQDNRPPPTPLKRKATDPLKQTPHTKRSRSSKLGDPQEIIKTTRSTTRRAAVNVKSYEEEYESETNFPEKNRRASSETNKPEAYSDHISPTKTEEHRPLDSKGHVRKQTKRKTREEKEAAMVPLAERSTSTLLKIGAHVSAAGGVHNAVTNAIHIGGNAFALFLKSQRKWVNPEIKPEARDQFESLCQIHNYLPTKDIVPHGSYLVNLCALDHGKANQAYAGFLDDLQRCESLGVRLYNFHPGNTNGQPRQEALARLAKQLNKAHKATSSVVTLLENMAGGRDRQGNTVGGAFEDLRDVISQIDDKDRVGVCIDTCHAFASGYDLRTPEAFEETFAEFDEIIGARYLRAFHVNDSKAPLGSKRDLHANIGTGFLGLRAFHTLCNSTRFNGIPMVLETPIDHKDDSGKTIEDKNIWSHEIKLLESLAGMDPEGDEFRKLERELRERGAGERARLQAQFDKKKAKSKKYDSEDESHSSCREH